MYQFTLFYNLVTKYEKTTTKYMSKAVVNCLIVKYIYVSKCYMDY